MAYNWDAIQAQAQGALAPQGPGLGQQFAQKAANKIATDQVAKLGLQAAGTAAAGPLGGVAGQVAGELAGPLASQFVGSLFNKGGAVYKQGGGNAQATYDWLYSINPGAAAKYLQAITDTSGELVGKPAQAGEIVIPKEEIKKQAAEKVMPEVIAPRAKARAEWNVPLGEALGAEWSTQGHYADMDQGKDPWGAMLKGTWRFEQGGDVKQKGWWDKAKSAVSKAASHAWKNDNLEKPAGRWKNVQYKNIGGMTPGPLGMSDLLEAGKDKAISKVKLKKAKGDMSEEVEYNYHPPLAAKPKPTGE